MKRLAWELRGWLQAAGAAGLAGAVVALAGLALYQLGAVSLERDIEAATGRLTALQARARRVEQGAQGPGTTPERLAAFYGFFPRLDELPELLDKVYAAAARQSIALERGDYVLARERDGKLLRYQLTLPVRASYPQVRAFLESVLRDVPAAALDSVAFQRESVAASQVDAQLRFTLVLGGS